jgi:putative endonuclease
MVDSDGALVFVEVKTRANEDFGPSESAVTAAKKTRTLRAARYFLASHKIDDRPYRFDVVTIVLAEKGPAEFRHYENAFTP